MNNDHRFVSRMHSITNGPIHHWHVLVKFSHLAARAWQADAVPALKKNRRAIASWSKSSRTFSTSTPSARPCAKASSATSPEWETLNSTCLPHGAGFNDGFSLSE